MGNQNKKLTTWQGTRTHLLQSMFIFSLVLLLGACQTTISPQSRATLSPTLTLGQPSNTGAPQSSTLIIFAASSLTEAFTELGKEFEAQNPDIKLVFNFAGSQQLAQLLNQGVAVDVFASANLTQMEAAMAADRIETDAPLPLIGNRLVLVYARQNPANLRSFKDLAKPGVKLALADEDVPAGQYTLEFLENASQLADYGPNYKEEVLKNVTSFEENVRAVLKKVEKGEADAGIVYQTDVGILVAPNVGVREIPASLNVNALYYIAPIQNSPNPETAGAFIEFLLSSEIQDRLRSYGFLPIQ